MNTVERSILKKVAWANLTANRSKTDAHDDDRLERGGWNWAVRWEQRTLV